MLPAPLRPLVRPRYAVWLLFVGLFVGTALFYRGHGRGRRVPARAPPVMVSGTAVGREWVAVPRDAVLPAGLDVEVDMQTGGRRVRLGDEQRVSEHLGVPVGAPVDAMPEEISPLAQRKWQRVYDSQHRTVVDQMLDDLSSPHAVLVAEALAYLEERAGAVDVGAGLVRSPLFGNLLVTLQDGRDAGRRISAADILFACVQNNPVAVEGVLATDAVEFLAGRLEHETDGTVLRRLLSILAAMVRADRTPSALLAMAKHQLVLSLSHLAARRVGSVPVLDRILVLLVLLVGAPQLRYAETPQAVNLMEHIIKTLPAPHSDWMTHEFRPWCLAQPAVLAGKPALTAFCRALNSSPEDGSLLQ